MNTGNQNTMNITQRSVYGRCNLKCSFSSKYEIFTDTLVTQHAA